MANDALARNVSEVNSVVFADLSYFVERISRAPNNDVSTSLKCDEDTSPAPEEVSIKTTADGIIQDMHEKSSKLSTAVFKSLPMTPGSGILATPSARSLTRHRPSANLQPKKAKHFRWMSTLDVFVREMFDNAMTADVAENFTKVIFDSVVETTRAIRSRTPRKSRLEKPGLPCSRASAPTWPTPLGINGVFTAARARCCPRGGARDVGVARGCYLLGRGEIDAG